jgi:hypothetical protein
MVSPEIRQLIDDVIKTHDHSVTTDWLSYCLLRSVEIELLEEKEIVVQQSIKSGVPAVGIKKLIDSGDGNQKNQYSLLCRHNFTICIEIVEDVNVDDSNKDFVNVKVRQYFLTFNDPDSN